MEIGEIHNQFHKTLRNYIKGRVQNDDDAADILQEVFAKIASRIESLSSEDKLQNWIFVIARNAITDHFRAISSKKQTEFTERLADELEDETCQDVTKGIEKCLLGFIQKLPDDYRTIILESEVRGIKQKDLAEIYKMAYPSIRSRIQRGRSRLKEMLLNCCMIEVDRRGNVIEAIHRGECASDCEDCATPRPKVKANDNS